MVYLSDVKRQLVERYLEILRDPSRTDEERRWAADQALDIMGIDLCDLCDL